MLRMNGLEPPDMSLLANMIPEGGGASYALVHQLVSLVTFPLSFVCGLTQEDAQEDAVFSIAEAVGMWYDGKNVKRRFFYDRTAWI